MYERYFKGDRVAKEIIMKKKFFIALVLALTAVLCFATACTKDNTQIEEEANLIDIEYDLPQSEDSLKNAVTLYDNTIQWMKVTYAFANRTKPLPETEDCPSEITNVINSKEEFDKAYYEFPAEIDFDKQTLVLYFFASCNILSQNGKRLSYYELTDVTEENTSLTFDVTCVKASLLIKDEPYADVSKPTQLCLAVLMPKTQISDFKFNFEYKKYYIEWSGELKDNSTLYKGDLEWLRDEYGNDISSSLEYKKTLTDKIQTHEEYVTAFKKFYNTFDTEDDMLVLYFLKKDADDTNLYEYSVANIEYDEGYLDISLNQRFKGTHSGDGSDDIDFIIVKLPQLPAYNVNVKIL